MNTSFGMHLPRRGHLATGEGVAAIAKHSEELGFGSLWAGEHVVIPTSLASKYPYSSDGAITWRPETPYLDPLISLTWAAAATTTTVVGTCIMLLPLRDSVATAKSLATLDHLSGGRVAIGVAAGWLREEFEILGRSFDDRGPNLDIAIETLRKCWGEDPVVLPHLGPELAFHMQPKPERPGGVPILAGGKTRASLRRVARLCDGWIPSHLTPEEVRKGLEYLRPLMEEQERSLEELAVTPAPGKEVKVTRSMVEDYFAAGATSVLCDADYEGSLADALRSLESCAARVMS